ncbi:MAG: HepT-like ribonuclease domain-containing protein [Parcubacteria group bacterium]
MALIERHIKGLTLEEFVGLENELVQNLAMRQLEIIGEATKNLSREIFNSDESIPWQEVGDMRNKLIHEYFSVDLYIVWETIQENLPPLKLALQKFDDSV